MCDLVDYRVAYGECVGYCASVLTIAAPLIQLIQTSNVVGDPPLQFRGSIVPDIAVRIQNAAAAVDVQHLSVIYGDPDARDEGVVTIRLRHSTGATQHSFSRGSPPDALATLDSLLSPIVLGWIDRDPPMGVQYHDSP